MARTQREFSGYTSLKRLSSLFSASQNRHGRNLMKYSKTQKRFSGSLKSHSKLLFCLRETWAGLQQKLLILRDGFHRRRHTGNSALVQTAQIIRREGAT